MKKKLLTIVAAGMIALTGCQKEYKTGIVEKEYWFESKLEKSADALFGNESVKIKEGNYVIEIRTDVGIYTASISSGRLKGAEGLFVAIEEGDEVKFVTKDPCKRGNTFGKDKVGKITTDQIKIIRKQVSDPIYEIAKMLEENPKANIYYYIEETQVPMTAPRPMTTSGQIIETNKKFTAQEYVLQNPCDSTIKKIIETYCNQP